MAIDTRKLETQAVFCADLMDRLTSDIINDIDEDAYHGVWNYTQKQADIIRLRRELNKLNKLLYPYEGVNNADA